MKILLLSDIHGNLAALQSVMDKIDKNYKIDACILLGDIIDYGMHSNEVIKLIKNFSFPILCNLWGNHENAIINGRYEKFSSERGKQCAQYTRSILSQESWKYLMECMVRYGKKEFECYGKKCLAVHASLLDEFWGKMEPEKEIDEYVNFDYVFSGHTHIPFFLEKYVRGDDLRKRNKKKVIFINPGSVGQPRNLNPMAQFAILDIKTEKIIFEKVLYDIQYEQKTYNGQVDDFYKNRLEIGV